MGSTATTTDDYNATIENKDPGETLAVLGTTNEKKDNTTPQKANASTDLLKVHKDGVPLNPIISSRISLTSELANTLLWLSPAIANIKNTRLRRAKTVRGYGNDTWTFVISQYRRHTIENCHEHLSWYQIPPNFQ